MICLLLPGNPYPVIESPQTKKHEGKPLENGYQSHYVVTKMDGLPFDLNDSSLIGYSIFNEIVVSQESQVVPIFIVQLKSSNFDTIKQQFNREENPTLKFVESPKGDKVTIDEEQYMPVRNHSLIEEENEVYYLNLRDGLQVED